MSAQDDVANLKHRLEVSERSNRRLRSCLQHAEEEMGRHVLRIAMEWDDAGGFTIVATSGDKARERWVVEAFVDEMRRLQLKVPQEGPYAARDISGDGTAPPPSHDGEVGK